MNFERTGLYFEEFAIFTPDDIIIHDRAHVITQESNMQYSMAIGETQPLHIDAVYAKTTQFGQIVVSGNQTKAIIEALSVPDLTHGTIVANLQTDKVKTPKPVYIDDELTVITHVLATEPSQSNPNVGKVIFEHHGFNQSGEEVMSEIRTVLMQKIPMTSVNL